MRVSVAVDRYLAEASARGQLAPKSVVTYRQTLRGFIAATGDPDVSDLTRRHVHRWWGSLSCGPRTSRGRLSNVRCFLAWLIDTEAIKVDPSRGMKPPTVPEPVGRNLTAVEVAAILKVAPDTRGTLVVLLMVQLGLRCAEVTGLEVGHVNRTTRGVRVLGKGGKVRVLPLTAQVEEALDAYLAEHPTPAGPLIRSFSNGAPITSNYLGILMSKWMSEAGVKRYRYDGRSAHALRHTMATDVLDSGANIRHLQVALGHSSLQTTQRYLGWTADGIRDAVEGRWYGPRAS